MAETGNPSGMMQRQVNGMKKGESTRLEILQVADRLFCSKGYDQTSVQDILDIIHGSKGGFYHHFPSKDAVLQTLCQQRAERAKARANESLISITDPLIRLNTIFTHCIPLRMDDASFIATVLPLLRRPEGMTVRVVYQDAIIDAFKNLLDREISRAKSEQVLFPCANDIGITILTLTNAFWLECALLIPLDSSKDANCASVIPVLNRYRMLLEHMLNAPYGSISLMNLEQWEEFTNRVMLLMKHGI